MVTSVTMGSTFLPPNPARSFGPAGRVSATEDGAADSLWSLLLATQPRSFGPAGGVSATEDGAADSLRSLLLTTQTRSFGPAGGVSATEDGAADSLWSLLLSDRYNIVESDDRRLTKLLVMAF
jgi:hypothetical protein